MTGYHNVVQNSMRQRRRAEVYRLTAQEHFSDRMNYLRTIQRCVHFLNVLHAAYRPSISQ